MALTKITTSVVAVNSLTSANIADNSIDATKIANNQILARHIASGSLTDQLGTLTALTVDNIGINGETITLTGSSATGFLQTSSDVLQFGTSTDDPIKIYTNNTEVATLLGNGTVAVGTTSTSGYGHFVVNSSGTQVALRASSGTASLGFFEAGAGRFYLKTLDGADGLAFIDGDGSTEHMRITTAGNVGINSSNPQTKFVVQHTDGQSGIEFSMGASLNYLQSYDRNASDYIALKIDGEDLRFGTNDGSERMRIASNGNVGIGNTNPQHPFIVHLTDGEIAMFGSNGMNAVGAYAGIGLGQVLADNTTYQKIQIVAEGRNSGSYVSNLHFLVDTAADSGSAVLADSKMMISGENGYLGVGLTAPKSRAEFHLDQVAAATDVNATASVHFGSQQHTDGAMMGITLGYREASLNYRKVGIFAEGRADNAARQNLLLCVDTASDAGSVRDADAKITIDGLSGECKIGNTTVETETYCLKVQTQHGYGRQGSANSSYFHHETDRAYNYWNEAGYFSGGAHTYSDETLKKDVVVISNALDSVAKMNGVTFNWIDPEKRGGKGTGAGKQFGVIAQNMLEVDAELPTLSVDPLAAGGNEETDDKLYSMDYARLSPYFIEAIKELKTKLEAAEARIKTLEG